MAAKKEAAQAKKDAKKAAVAAAKEAKAAAKKDAKAAGVPEEPGRWEMGDEYWAQIFYVLGSGYAMLALFTATLGNFARCFNEGGRANTAQLETFVRAAVGMSYVYLFIYGWLLVGPVAPRGRMTYVNVFFGLYLATCLGLWGFGTYVASGAVLPPCWRCGKGARSEAATATHPVSLCARRSSPGGIQRSWPWRP